MATSTIWTYQLNGVTREFGVKFDYLSRKFIQVTLIGSSGKKPLRFLTDYRFLNAGTIITNEAWGPSRGYDLIEIKRVTSATDLIVDFTDGSILRANDLTESNLQAMHIAEEARDIAGDGIGVDDEGNLDARNRRIVNLATPVNRRDAVTKAYVDDARDGVIANKDETKRYRDEALQFRNAAEGFDDSAEQQANLARKHAEDSRKYGASASALINNASNILKDVETEGVIANGYANATIQNAQASAHNTTVTTLNAQLTQQNKEQCAGHEAATAVYEQSAREAQLAAKSSQTVSEESAKMAKQSESKALDSKTKAEAARDAAIQNSKNSDAFARSADESAKAAAKSAEAASTSAGNAITQASNAQHSASDSAASAARAEAAAASVNLDKTFVKPKRLSKSDTFNNLTDGVYYAPDDNSVEASRPVKKAGTLEVSADGYLQRFYSWNAPQCWWRYCKSKGRSSWTYSDWYRMDGMRPKTMNNSNDLNTFLEDGFYTRYDNPPSGWEGLHYPEQKAGLLQVMRAWGGNGTFQIYTTYLGVIYVRWTQNGVWDSWRRQATKDEVDSKVSKSDVLTNGINNTSTSKVVSGYQLEAIMRREFTTKWSGNQASVTLDFEGDTYGLEILVKVSGYSFKFEFGYAPQYQKYLQYFDASSNRYITVTQSNTSITVTGNNGLMINQVDFRYLFKGRPL